MKRESKFMSGLEKIVSPEETTPSLVTMDATAETKQEPKTKFDPLKHLLNTNRLKNYLPIPWRIVWLRSEHPNATIETTLIEMTEDKAVFSCRIATPDGGLATAFGSETKGDFGDWFEKAETKAIGRALVHLGYGSQYVEHEYADSDIFSQSATAGLATSAPRGARPRGG